MKPYVIGSNIYPSHDDAPTWRWEKIGERWVELDRPEPLYTMIYFPPKPRHRKEDYPPHLHRAVDRANRMSNLSVFTPIALGRADPQHLFETLELVDEGEWQLSVWRGSKGYTETWTDPAGRGGFVVNDGGA